MKLSLPLAVAAALAGGTAAARSVIVEFDQAPVAHYVAQQRQAGMTVSDAELAARRAALAQAQDQFLNELTFSGVHYSIERFQIPGPAGEVTAIDARYTLVMNGIALDVPDGSVDFIASLAGVKQVHPSVQHKLAVNNSVSYIRAPELYGGVAELNHWDTLNEGLEGQGIHISVIDSGVEWSHEMFGGDPLPPRFGLAPESTLVATNEKVTYHLPLFDFGVDNFGHGTHVAATAGGYLGFAPGDDQLPLTADDIELHGVAPQARLMSYQVCNGTGSASGTAGCLTASIILAIEDSVSPVTLTGFAKPVADVINLSLGGSGGPDDATANAADNAALTGAIVVAAAGNDGPDHGTVGSPSAGQHVISVAASNDAGVYPNRIEVAGAGSFAGTQAPDSNATLPITAPITANYVDAGFAHDPTEVPDAVSGNICLVSRGGGYEVEEADQSTGLFATKALNCEAKGAIATVIYNNVPGQIGGALAPAVRPVITTSDSAGAALVAAGFDGSGVSLSPMTIHLPDADLFDPTITGFSSRGPVQGLGQVKPDLAAPGEQVLAATTPIGAPVVSMQSANRYTNASGTSMASPHVAGAAALIRQAHRDWTPDMVRTALQNTATNPRQANGMPEADGRETNDIIAQGAGLIDVYEAVHAKALMGVAGDGIQTPGILGSHSFGEIPAVASGVVHTESVAVEIRDLSGEGGLYHLSTANNRDLELDGLDVTVTPSSVTLAPGGRATVQVNAQIDGMTVVDTLAVKVHGGSFIVEPIEMQWFVAAERSDGAESLRMPFWLRPTMTNPIGADEGHSAVLAAIEGEEGALDFDGEYAVDWTIDGSPREFVVERSLNGGAFVEIARVTSPGFEEEGLASGSYAYQITAIYDGEIGSFIAEPSNVESITVDLREAIDATAQVSVNTENAGVDGGVTYYDVSLTNNGGELLPGVELVITGTSDPFITVANADYFDGNGDPVFSFDNELGGNGTFESGETTDTRRIEFNNLNYAEFSYQTEVRAVQRVVN